jgi:hypothetical protein
MFVVTHGYPFNPKLLHGNRFHKQHGLGRVEPIFLLTVLGRGSYRPEIGDNAEGTEVPVSFSQFRKTSTIHLLHIS